jgi:hypothetical protein
METQPVNSFNEAIELLARLKDMETPVRINLGFPNTMISFEGNIVRADKSGLEIVSIAGPNAGHFKIEPLEKFEFHGGVSSVGNELHIHFMIVREGNFNDLNMPRTSLNAVFIGVRQTDAAANKAPGSYFCAGGRTGERSSLDQDGFALGCAGFSHRFCSCVVLLSTARGAS